MEIMKRVTWLIPNLLSPLTIIPPAKNAGNEDSTSTFVRQPVSTHTVPQINASCVRVSAGRRSREFPVQRIGI